MRRANALQASSSIIISNLDYSDHNTEEYHQNAGYVVRRDAELHVILQFGGCKTQREISSRYERAYHECKVLADDHGKRGIQGSNAVGLTNLHYQRHDAVEICVGTDAESEWKSENTEDDVNVLAKCRPYQCCS